MLCLLFYVKWDTIFWVLSYLQIYDSFAFKTIQNQGSPFSFDIAKVAELNERSSLLYDIVKNSLKFETTLKGNSIS